MSPSLFINFYTLEISLEHLIFSFIYLLHLIPALMICNLYFFLWLPISLLSVLYIFPYSHIIILLRVHCFPYLLSESTVQLPVAPLCRNCSHCCLLNFLQSFVCNTMPGPPSVDCQLPWGQKLSLRFVPTLLYSLWTFRYSVDLNEEKWFVCRGFWSYLELKVIFPNTEDVIYYLKNCHVLF